MMQVSGRSLLCLLVSYYGIFIFELLSESSVNLFHFSGYFCSASFGVYATGNLEKAQQYLVYIVCYEIFNRFHIGKREEVIWHNFICTFIHFSATELALRSYLL